MKRRGREVCRGLGDLGDQLRLMGRPGPSDPVWTTRSRSYRRRLCGRKKSERAASLSVGAGRARRATGGPPAEPSPRDRLPTPVPCCLHRAEACVGTVRDGARCATRTRSQVHDSGHLCTRPFGRLREGGREVRFHGCGFRRTSRGKRRGCLPASLNRFGSGYEILNPSRAGVGARLHDRPSPQGGGGHEPDPAREACPL
jgi:hypothetical protein